MSKSLGFESEARAQRKEFLTRMGRRSGITVLVKTPLWKNVLNGDNVLCDRRGHLCMLARHT